MFSVVILTLNEERDIPRCLHSAAGIDDLVVLDSGSTDRTTEIAGSHGARVFTRPFDTFAGQRNFAQTEIPFKYRWVFHLDADETLTPELVAECSDAARRTDVDGFYVAPRMLWRGKWIPHCTDFPAYQARFVRVPGFQFIEVGHGQREAGRMRMDYLRASYFHELAGGGDREWLEKHRRYAAAEAQEHSASKVNASWRGLFSGDKLTRRRCLKRLSYSLPARPTLRFLYQYLLRGGFIDGATGLHYCRLLFHYERFVSAAMKAQPHPRA